MATLEALRAAVLPGARWVAAGDGASTRESPAAPREIAWIRLLRARIPAVEALEPGDVVIAPLAALAVVAPDDDALATFLESAVEAGAAGLVLVAEETAGGASAVPGAMLDRVGGAAAVRGLPVIDAGGGDAAALERSAIGFLVNERAAIDHQATILENRLQQVALAGGGAEAFAAAIGGFLGRAVAIEGRRGLVLAVHAPPDVPGAAAAVAAYHRRPRGVGARIPLPIPGGDVGTEPPGALLLLGDRPSSELERVATARIAGLLALELARDEAVGRAVESARRETLPSDGPPWVVIVARQAAPDEPFDSARREALRRDLRALASARRMTLRGDVESVEVRLVTATVEDDPTGLVLTGRVGRLLGRTAAVSRSFTDAAARSAAEAEARATLEAAERLSAPPPVARSDRLPAYRLLGALHNLPDGERQARALLGPLLVGRPDVVRERLATLRVLLEQPGLSEAAAALGVHRNTIAYRIRRIESVTGWQLADPELRFPLALALRFVHDDQT